MTELEFCVVVICIAVVAIVFLIFVFYSRIGIALYELHRVLRRLENIDSSLSAFFVQFEYIKNRLTRLEKSNGSDEVQPLQ